jgi:hypothetical protein
MPRDRFTFTENFKELADALDDDKRLKFYDAITNYIFKDIEPTDPFIAALFNSMKYLLDRTQFWGGKRTGAGAPRGNNNAKRNNQVNQDSIKIQSNDNQETIKNNQINHLDCFSYNKNNNINKIINNTQELNNNTQESNKGVVGGKEKGVQNPNPKTTIDWADVLDRWNRIADKYNLSKISVITDKRKQQFKARLAEHKITPVEFFDIVNKGIGTSWFLQGQRQEVGSDGIPQMVELDNKWKASFDFCLQSQSFSRIRENFYGKDCPELLVEWELLEKGEGNAD